MVDLQYKLNNNDL